MIIMVINVIVIIIDIR